MKKIKLAMVLTFCFFSVVGFSFSGSAKIFELSVTPRFGYMWGPQNFAGIITQKPDGSMGADFYNQYSGGLFGGEINVEVLHIDVRARVDQFFDGSGLTGTILQPMVGYHYDNFFSGKHQLLLGIHVGGVIGFNSTPNFPIDRDQIATYGAALEGQVGYEYRANRFVAFNLIATPGFHFMVAGAAPVNDQSTKTDGFHLLLTGGIRFHTDT